MCGNMSYFWVILSNHFLWTITFEVTEVSLQNKLILKVKILLSFGEFKYNGRKFPKGLKNLKI